MSKPQIKRKLVSISLPEPDLLDFILFRARGHKGGVSGYIRSLILLDRVKYGDLERIRNQVLATLTPVQKEALGFPSEVDTNKPTL